MPFNKSVIIPKNIQRNVWSFVNTRRYFDCRFNVFWTLWTSKQCCVHTGIRHSWLIPTPRIISILNFYNFSRISLLNPIHMDSYPFKVTHRRKVCTLFHEFWLHTYIHFHVSNASVIKLLKHEFTILDKNSGENRQL